MGMTTFSGPVRSLAGFIGGADSFAPVAALPRTLTNADIGKTLVIGAATGNVVLPLATSEIIGASYNLAFSVNATAVKVMTTTTTPGDKFAGMVSVALGGGAVTAFMPNNTTNDVMNLTSTTGGNVGSTLTLTATAPGVWTASGTLIALAGPVATPFADA